MHHHPKPNEFYLKIALLLTSVFTVIEIIAGILTGSLAVLGDAAHMFTDVAALVIAYTAVQLGKKTADTKRTFGYYRLEILAAALNAVILLLLSAYIFFEAYHRLRGEPSEIHPTGMLFIGCLGLIVNFISIRLLHAGSQHSLNVRGAYLEAWADMLSSGGVILASIFIFTTGWHMIDAIVAVCIGLWVIPRSWILLKESINILLEGVPAGIELAAINDALSGIAGVKDVHDLHVWALTSGKISLTVHLVINQGVEDIQKILQAANKCLEEQFNITHSTVQLETNHCGHDDLRPHTQV